MTLFSKSPYLTAPTKINYETGCIERFSEKTDVSRTIATARMELFVALVAFSMLTSFTKNPSKGAM